jgi:hypothetical protein
MGRTSKDLQPEEEQIRYWRLLWLSSIQAFADSETQRVRWLDPNERNPYYSYVECMCGYFDDAYLGEESAYEKRLASGRISGAEIDAVADFHMLAAAYESPTGDDWDVKAILDDPAWQKLVEAAREAQRHLLPLLIDQAERAALTRPLIWKEDNGTYRAAATGSTIVR